MVWTGLIEVKMVRNDQIEPLIFAHVIYEKKREVKVVPGSERSTELPFIEVVRIKDKASLKGKRNDLF